MSTPDYRVLGPGHYSLLIDGRSYEVFVRSDKKGFLVEVDGHLIPVSPQGASGTAATAEEKGGLQVICSPMPGRVIGIKVAVGDSVKSGQGIIVVEAMKMENELQASRAGKVISLKVKVGDTVESGQELVVIE